MKLVCCAVFDVASQAFMRPLFVQTRAVAMRVIADELARPADGNMLAAHPADFRLFELCEWDDQSGMFTGAERLPALICDVISLVPKP